MEQAICTKFEFDKAREIVLQHLRREGYASKGELTRFKVFGISPTSIDLVVRDLIRKGIVEELFRLPVYPEVRGQRKEYFALTAALDAKAVELPVGFVRESKAFDLIAETA